MARLNWTEESRRWLEDIHGFIAADSPLAAAQTAQGVYERAQLLIEHPEIGHRYAGSTRHIRILLYGHYRITYLNRPDGDIDILGVFHGALDIGRYEL